MEIKWTSDVDLTVKDICENSVSGKIKKILVKYFISNHQKFSFWNHQEIKTVSEWPKMTDKMAKKNWKMAVEKLPENDGWPAKIDQNDWNGWKYEWKYPIKRPIENVVTEKSRSKYRSKMTENDWS